MSKQIKPNIYIIIHRSNNLETMKQSNISASSHQNNGGKKPHHLFIVLTSINLTMHILANFTVNMCRMIHYWAKDL